MLLAPHLRPQMHDGARAWKGRTIDMRDRIAGHLKHELVVGVGLRTERPPQAIVGRRLAMHGGAQALARLRRNPKDRKLRVADPGIGWCTALKAADLAVQHHL